MTAFFECDSKWLSWLSEMGIRDPPVSGNAAEWPESMTEKVENARTEWKDSFKRVEDWERIVLPLYNDWIYEYLQTHDDISEHLQFLLKKYKAQGTECDLNLYRSLVAFLSLLSKWMQEEHPALRFYPDLGGSTSQGTKLGPMDEWDFKLHFNESFKYNDPAFDNMYHSMWHCLEMMKKVTCKRTIGLRLKGYIINNARLPSLVFEWQTSEVGPVLLIKADLAPTVSCGPWKGICNKNPRTNEDIVFQRYILLYGSNKMPPKIESPTWRPSSSEVEQSILRDLPPIVKGATVLLKIISSNLVVPYFAGGVPKECKFTSYNVKDCLFWAFHRNKMSKFTNTEETKDKDRLELTVEAAINLLTSCNNQPFFSFEHTKQRRIHHFILKMFNVLLTGTHKASHPGEIRPKSDQQEPSIEKPKMGIKSKTHLDEVGKITFTKVPENAEQDSEMIAKKFENPNSGHVLSSNVQLSMSRNDGSAVDKREDNVHENVRKLQRIKEQKILDEKKLKIDNENVASQNKIDTETRQETNGSLNLTLATRTGFFARAVPPRKQLPFMLKRKAPFETKRESKIKDGIGEKNDATKVICGSKAMLTRPVQQKPQPTQRKNLVGRNPLVNRLRKSKKLAVTQRMCSIPENKLLEMIVTKLDEKATDKLRDRGKSNKSMDKSYMCRYIAVNKNNQILIVRKSKKETKVVEYKLSSGDTFSKVDSKEMTLPPENIPIFMHVTRDDSIILSYVATAAKITNTKFYSFRSSEVHWFRGKHGFLKAASECLLIYLDSEKSSLVAYDMTGKQVGILQPVPETKWNSNILVSIGNTTMICVLQLNILAVYNSSGTLLVAVDLPYRSENFTCSNEYILVVGSDDNLHVYSWGLEKVAKASLSILGFDDNAVLKGLWYTSDDRLIVWSDKHNHGSLLTAYSIEIK